MTTQTTTIKGTFTGHNADGEFNWECPFTGDWKTCSGQFDYDENGYFHDVRDEDGNILYIVTQ